MVLRPRPVVIIRGVEDHARETRPARLAGSFADARGRKRRGHAGQEEAGAPPRESGPAAAAPGNVNQIVVPTPTSEVGQIRPPWR